MILGYGTLPKKKHVLGPSSLGALHGTVTDVAIPHVS